MVPCLFLFGCALVPFGLFAWAQWLRRNTSAPRFASRIAYVLVGLVLLMPLGAVVMLYGTMSPESVDEFGRPHVVTVDEDLSFVIEILAPVLLTALWLLFATWRWHWSARRPVMPREAPYR
jgi:nicotinamide riboside transporter PnuC